MSLNLSVKKMRRVRTVTKSSSMSGGQPHERSTSISITKNERKGVEGLSGKSNNTRRFVLSLVGSGVGASLLSFGQPSNTNALAGQYTGKKQWDGIVRGSQCEVDESGDECRLREIGKDQERLKESVSKSSNAPTSTSSQAAPKIDDEYFKSTDSLISEIDAYLELDVFDKRRREATGEITTNGKTWVSKYAPGGSARLQSAQKIYVIVDSLLGHFAQNGFAPLPPDKKNNIRNGMEKASVLLAQQK